MSGSLEVYDGVEEILVCETHFLLVFQISLFQS